MNTVKKLDLAANGYDPESYSPKAKPEIVELAEQMKKGVSTLMIEHGNNPRTKIFETERLIIRRFTPDDWTEVQQLAINKESSEGAVYDHQWPTSEDECKGMTEYFSGNASFWAVCLKTRNNIIGFIALDKMDDGQSLDLGHVFHTNYDGNEYDTEAIARMMRYAFEKLDIHRIIANNAAAWKRQWAPLEKLGMKIIDQDKASLRSNADGTAIEFVSYKMEITKEDFFSTRRNRFGQRI